MHQPLTAETIADRLNLAQDAHLRARRSEALAYLEGCDEWASPANEKALALRAEILTLPDPIAALQELAVHQDAFVTDEGRFDYYVASARAYTNSRNFDGAREMLDSAQQLLHGSGDPRAGRVAYQRARLKCITREYDPNDPDLALALRDPDPELQFGALSWRSWMHAGLEDYRGQLHDLQTALQTYEREGARCNLVSVATSLHAMLRLAFELGDAPASSAGEAAYETLDWTSDIQHYRFLCARALGWDKYVNGDPARAQWLFKDSKTFAPTTAWKVMAHVDRAYVARMNDNEAWAREELEQANVLADRVSWGATKGEERLALVTMAILFAPVDMARAQRYVSTYISLGLEGIDPTLAAVNDRRAVAFEKYATGCVQRVLGNKQLAIRSLEAAFEIFTQTEHFYRAALAADALHEITGQQAWLEIARADAARFPRSGICRKLHSSERREQEPVLAQLTPVQQQIARGVAEGLDMNELSKRFSRSTFTIERQLDAIASGLGLRSRGALRSELRKRGIA